MRQLTAAALVLAFVGLASMARAEDKANPNGTWKWTVNFGGQDREFALKLKADGDKLTVIVPVEKFLARPLLHVTIEKRDEVVAVEMDLKGLFADSIDRWRHDGSQHHKPSWVCRAPVRGSVRRSCSLLWFSHLGRLPVTSLGSGFGGTSVRT